MDDNAELVPLGSNGAAPDPLNPLTLSAAFPPPNPLRAAAPSLYDYVTKPPVTPLGAFPSEPGKLPAEWQRGSVLDAIPALTDVAGLALPSGKGAIFVGPGSRLLRGAVREVPKNVPLHWDYAEAVNNMRRIAGLESATFPSVVGESVGSGGIPRTEIRDTGARLVQVEGKPNEWQWKHPAGDLHELYGVPNIKFNKKMLPGDAAVDTQTKEILLGGEPNATNNHLRLGNQIVGHEFQHIIQRAEGLPVGSSPWREVYHPEYWKAIGQEMPKEKAALDKEADNIYGLFSAAGWQPTGPRTRAAFDLYRRSAGEVEAENVVSRAANPELYNKLPELTQYIPTSKQIVRYTTDASGTPRRLVPVEHAPFDMRLTLKPTSEPYEHPDMPLQRAAGEQHFHDFTMHNEGGDEVGSMTINSHDPRHLYIEWIGAYGKGRDFGSATGLSGINSLGPKEIRSLVDEVRRHFPEAETISGFRASGARWHGKPDNPTDPRYLASGGEPVIRLRGGKPPSFD